MLSNQLRSGVVLLGLCSLGTGRDGLRMTSLGIWLMCVSVPASTADLFLLTTRHNALRESETHAFLISRIFPGCPAVSSV